MPSSPMSTLIGLSKFIIVVGPTASGKSAVAVRLAKKFNGEVISADSRQVYRGLDIGTGKITKKEAHGVPHHLLDVTSPKKTFTVAQYQKLGQRAIRDVLRRNKLPIICGGSGFYIDALLYEYGIPEVTPNPALRRELGTLTAERLFTTLQKLDPRRAAAIDRHNKRRLVRALEIILQTGKPVPDVSLRQAQGKFSQYEILKLGIRLPDSELKQRIRKRLITRMRQGMTSETRRLHERGLSWKRMEELGLEYRYLARFLQGTITKSEMLAQLEKEIWHYAKRQMTWFKRDKAIRWIRKPKEAFGLIKKFLL